MICYPIYIIKQRISIKELYSLEVMVLDCILLPKGVCKQLVTVSVPSHFQTIGLILSVDKNE